MKSLRVLVGVLIILLFSPFSRAQDMVRINEFMAINNNGLDDEDGEEHDWIELYNAGSNAVNLAGWRLTDSTNALSGWTFPSVTIAPGGFLVVFASNKNRNQGELHTNFRLNNDGEYLGLIRSNGTVATEFSPNYPVQAPDISYGLQGFTGQEVLLAQGAPAKAHVPLNGSLEDPPGPTRLRPWTVEGLNDSGWQSGFTGVGYEADTGYESFLGLNVVGMQNVNETVYIRIPFEVDDPTKISALTLRMRFDDGFIAYINGREVAWNNSPDPAIATWTNGAPQNRADTAAVVPMDFNISSLIDFLHVGTNLLAVQGLNNGIGSSDLLILPEIVATITGSGTPTLRYFPQPTPGAANNSGVSEIGPIIEEADHRPAVPTDSDALRVFARIRPARGQVASATLHYRINYGTEATVPFRDDGNSGDEGTGDGIYGAIIPASASTPGQMVRWYIRATDTVGGNSRLPAFVEPLNSPEYFGTIVHNPTLTNPLPVLHWFIQNINAAATDAGTRCSLFYDGIFYDNCYINIHGQSSRSFPKKSYDIDFHPGHNFKWQDGQPRADDINLLTTFPDKAHMRNALAYDTYRDAGNAHHWVIPVRVQQNGAFWGTAHIVENGDEDWLVRMGINSQGALYKMYNTFTTVSHATTGAEKKTRKNENNADLTALFNGISLTGEARRRFLYDNLDVAGVVNFLATKIITGDTDCCHKNYYFYRDTGLSGEWQMWPWDVDLSFGRRWATDYWDHNMIPNTSLNIGNNNLLVQAVFATPEMYQMYVRRIRTLMDELIKPTGTLVEQLHFEPRIDELAAQLSADATLDAAKWNSHAWGNGSFTNLCCPQTYAQAIADIKDVYLPARRNYLYGQSAIPAAQPPGTVINFNVVEVNPSNGNQEQEYIQLRNPNSFAVDISGWRLAGGVSFVFRGGTVIPSLGNLYVAANRVAWRARTSPPTGNQALQVVGDYEGRLSSRGQRLELIDRQGVPVASVNTPANPSAAQSALRITEIMYHPPILQSDTFGQEEYEYIELSNIGSTQLSLTGVHFSEGLQFNFSGSSITTLAAGQRVLVVKNLSAFTQRYGSGPAARVAGVYVGSLDNGGERIRLADPGNEDVLDFEYNNSWYPITDGRGFSLVIINPAAPFHTWNLKESWRPSGRQYGSPGGDDSAPALIAPILVNEVLSNTDAPQKDAVELYNPTAATVDVSGWYITDDPSVPKKFRIPATTTIPAGSYIYFDEDDFNPSPGIPPSFAFSSTDDEVYLYSGNSAGELTGYHHGFSFEPAATGVSFGRYIDSQGTEHFVAMASLTLGAANSGPRVGPVTISEIHYHPAQTVEGANLVENFEDEFIELHNITGSSVQLFDPANLLNTWRIRGGVDFDFPRGMTLPANDRLLVVSFNPRSNATATAAFRSRHGLSTNVLLAGPFIGRLANEGDEIRLRRPEAPVGNNVPYVLVDEVDYNDKAPWPIAADGFGPSLQRVSAQGFGNDPTNWVAATITPAATLAGGNPPVITAQPQDQTVVAGSNATLSVTATGDAPLYYRWIFEGNALAGKTNATLLLSNVTTADQGTYQVLVLNAAGSVVSSNAAVTVAIPPRITQQPRDTQAHRSANAIFVVQAFGSTPLSYRWRKDGSFIIPAQTGSFLSIPDVQPSDGGLYDVVVTNAVGAVTSQVARLTVLLAPVITDQPNDLSVTVVTPLNVTNSVTATSGTPLSYQWFFNGMALSPTANIPAVTNAAIIINNVNTSHSGDYYVVVTDSYASVTSRVAKLTVNTRPEILLQPISQAVPQGGTVSFSVAWQGSGPFLHRWRRTSPTSATLAFMVQTGGLAYHAVTNVCCTNGYIIGSQSNTVLVFTNVGTNLVGSYDVIVSNAVQQIQTDDGALTVIADTDRDGLPDSWETGRPGFNINNPDDARADADGDGVDNGDEYFAGTDYLDPNSYLQSEIQASGSVQLMFQAASNRTYTVQYNETLAGPWSNLVIEPARANTRNVTVVDPAPRPNRYYRLVTPPQP